MNVMNAVIDSILKENLDYYRRMKTIFVGRLLINKRGYLISKRLKDGKYVYLRHKVSGRSFYKYIGPDNSQYVDKIIQDIHQSKNDLIELRRTKDALKKLRAKDMNHEDFTGRIRELFQLMDKEGLWDEGLQLVGSWCFKFYQNYLDVEYYPERTVDVDFAIKIPYTGHQAKIGEKLKEMGFQEDRNIQDGSIVYRGGDIMVEFLKDRRGDGRKEGDPYIQELDIAPQSVPYLRILLDHPETYQFRDLGKITVPSMPAFLAHKLVVMERRRDQGKKEKDLRQARAVAKALLQSQKRLQTLHSVVKSLHKSQQTMVLKSARRADDLLPGASEVFQKALEGLG
jgi:hypothetical protein